MTYSHYEVALVTSNEGETMKLSFAKRACTCAVAALSLFGFGGCGSSQQSGTITWLSARSASEGSIKAIKQIADEYAKSHQGFKLEFQNISDRPSYNQKLKVLASSNRLPELWDADPDPYFAKLVKDGRAEDIGKLYKDIGVTNRFYHISTKYPTMADGSLHLMTFNANAEYFWYNKDAFRKAGIAEEPKTFDELLTDLQKLKDTGVIPIALDGKDQWPFYRFLGMIPYRETGNEFLAKLKVGKESMASPTGQAGIAFLQKMSAYFQPGFTNSDATATLNLFKSKRAAITYDGTWNLPSYVDDSGNLKSDIGYFRLPMLGKGDKTAPTDFFANSGIGTAVSKGKLTPQLKDFLKYLFDKYGDVALNDYRVIPSVKPKGSVKTPRIYQDVLSDIAKVNDYAQVWDVQLDANTVSVLGRQCQSLLVDNTSTHEFAANVDKAVAQYNKAK